MQSCAQRYDYLSSHLIINILDLGQSCHVKELRRDLWEKEWGEEGRGRKRLVGPVTQASHGAETNADFRNRKAANCPFTLISIWYFYIHGTAL